MAYVCSCITLNLFPVSLELKGPKWRQTGVASLWKCPNASHLLFIFFCGSPTHWIGAGPVICFNQRTMAVFWFCTLGMPEPPPCKRPGFPVAKTTCRVYIERKKLETMERERPWHPSILVEPPDESMLGCYLTTSKQENPSETTRRTSHWA